MARGPWDDNGPWISDNTTCYNYTLLHREVAYEAGTTGDGYSMAVHGLTMARI